MKYNVDIYRDLRVKVYGGVNVEADNEDEAMDKAWEILKETMTLGDIDIRDCMYDDDKVTLDEE